MKILLANPLYKYKLDATYERYYIRSGTRWPHSGVKITGKKPHYLPFPFSLAYAASYLKTAEFEIMVIDAVALDMDEQKFLQKVAQFHPDIVFYEMTAPTTRYDLALAEEIKEAINPIIVLGGAQATFFANEIVQKHPQIDYVIKGEYELILLQLVQYLKGDDSALPAGVVYRDLAQVVDTGEPETISNLDVLPSPSRELFPSNWASNPLLYWDGFCQLKPALQLQSSRGCNFNCYFCVCKQVMYRNKPYRAFSLDRVLDEISYLKKRYRVKEFYFDDDDFLADINRVVEFSQRLIKEKIDIKWSCMGNLTNLDGGVVRLMVKSGCIGIKFGVESGSLKVLQQLGKLQNLAKLEEILKICTRYGIKTQATFCIGLWGEEDGDINETLNLLKKLDVDSIQISFATPYPGTQVFEKIDRGGTLDRIDWEEFDGKRGRKTFSHFVSHRALHKFKRNAFYQWFLFHFFNPLWVYRHRKIILRVLKGWGFSFLIQQLISVFIDEWKNR